MVGLEVEQDGRLGGERLGVLELKRRHLADDRRVGGHLADQRCRRSADVAHYRHGQPGLAMDVTDPLGRSRLAVGPGHGDELVVDQPPRQLDLAEHRHSTAPRRHHDGGVCGYAGALDERPGAGGNGVA